MEQKELGKSGVTVPAMGVGMVLWVPGGSITEDAIMETCRLTIRWLCILVT